MKLSFAVLLAVANKWRGVRMDVFAARKVEELRNEFSRKARSEESSLTERGEPYGDLTGKLRLDRPKNEYQSDNPWILVTHSGEQWLSHSKMLTSFTRTAKSIP